MTQKSEDFSEVNAFEMPRKIAFGGLPFILQVAIIGKCDLRGAALLQVSRMTRKEVLRREKMRLFVEKIKIVNFGDDVRVAICFREKFLEPESLKWISFRSSELSGWPLLKEVQSCRVLDIHIEAMAGLNQCLQEVKEILSNLRWVSSFILMTTSCTVFNFVEAYLDPFDVAWVTFVDTSKLEGSTDADDETHNTTHFQAILKKEGFENFTQLSIGGNDELRELLFDVDVSTIYDICATRESFQSSITNLITNELITSNTITYYQTRAWLDLDELGLNPNDFFTGICRAISSQPKIQSLHFGAEDKRIAQDAAFKNRTLFLLGALHHASVEYESIVWENVRHAVFVQQPIGVFEYQIQLTMGDIFVDSRRYIDISVVWWQKVKRPTDLLSSLAVADLNGAQTVLVFLLLYFLILFQPLLTFILFFVHLRTRKTL